MIIRKLAPVLALSTTLIFSGIANGSAAETVSKVSAKSGTYTPAKASAERKAIMDALRVVIRKMSGLEVIFTVDHLKVNNGWAWAVVQPASADGTQHYETLTGLLHRKNGQWVYVEGPPEFAICEEDPDCIDPVRYFKKMAKKYPAASPDIFPKE
jgi:hypothetical protein